MNGISDNGPPMDTMNANRNDDILWSNRNHCVNAAIIIMSKLMSDKVGIVLLMRGEWSKIVGWLRVNCTMVDCIVDEIVGCVCR